MAVDDPGASNAAPATASCSAHVRTWPVSAMTLSLVPAFTSLPSGPEPAERPIQLWCGVIHHGLVARPVERSWFAQGSAQPECRALAGFAAPRGHVEDGRLPCAARFGHRHRHLAGYMSVLRCGTPAVPGQGPAPRRSAHRSWRPQPGCALGNGLFHVLLAAVAPSPVAGAAAGCRPGAGTVPAASLRAVAAGAVFRSTPAAA
jgi:hypothetical protein